MGKSTKLKQRRAADEEAALLQQFATLSRQAREVPPPPPLLDEFAAYRAHFVRSPDGFVLRTRSSCRAKQALEMARHLFGRYRVPRVLEQAWGAYVADPPARRPGRRELARRPEGLAANPNLRAIDFRAWYVCVATGGSLYKVHAHGWLTKKETHLFLGAPATLDVCQAMVYAVARATGAADGHALRLARSRLQAKPFIGFWFDVVRFFCLPGNLPATIAQVNDLVDYLDHRRAQDAAFRVLGTGQTLATVLRRMDQWHRELARARDLSGVEWAGVDLPDHAIEQRDPEHRDRLVTWTFHQITTGKELAAEGSAMRHCVFGYKHSCMQGRCSIWSLTRTDAFGAKARRLTIELDAQGAIVQKRGLANRAPRADEAHVVGLWARQFGLQDRRGW